MSTTFHPQTDDQPEVTNRILSIYLLCLARDLPRSWLRWLSWAKDCYTSSFQMTLKGDTLLGGVWCDPSTLLSYEAGMSKVPAVQQ
jgi:hypothetical protein